VFSHAQKKAPPSKYVFPDNHPLGGFILRQGLFEHTTLEVFYEEEMGISPGAVLGHSRAGNDWL